jgi:hypothetical protein
MLARPKIGTKSHIKLWLASKPASEVFSWPSVEHCACGQYWTEFYGQWPWPGLGYGGRRPIDKLNIIAHDLASNCQTRSGTLRRVSFGELYEAVCKAGW